ncbi:hypothetical protein ABFY48_23190 [Lysinibacillus pakistanensis]|uniref:hypothetical protein n=1 Tax=Lysinibacillus pakistanensis TaxID=759811 RepID=UPI003D29FE25
MKKSSPSNLGTSTKKMLDEEVEEVLSVNDCDEIDMFEMEDEFDYEIECDNFLQNAKFIPSSARTSGALTIVNNKNSKRVVLSKKVLTMLGQPRAIKFAIDEKLKTLILMFDDNEDGFTYVLKAVKGKEPSIIYCSDFVNQLTQLWDLNFENRSSVTLGKIEQENYRGETYVVITQ